MKYKLEHNARTRQWRIMSRKSYKDFWEILLIANAEEMMKIIFKNLTDNEIKSPDTDWKEVSQNYGKRCLDSAS